MERMAVRRRIEVPSMTASKRFGRYKRETTQGIRENTADDPVLRRLRNAFQRLVSACHSESDNPWEVMPVAESLLVDIGYEARDITRFSLMLPEIERGIIASFDEDVFADLGGLMLSALVNHSHEDTHLIKLQGLQTELNWVGHQNRKSIVVEGGLGMLLGCEMKGGSITVFGDAGEYAGSDLEGGLLVVSGDAGKRCGSGMKGGYLVIKGHAGHYVGQNMKDGTVVIEGSAETVGGSSMQEPMLGGLICIHGGEPPRIDSIRRGKVILKGKLIFESGHTWKG